MNTINNIINKYNNTLFVYSKDIIYGFLLYKKWLPAINRYYG